MYRYSKKIGNTDNISEWKPKGLTDEVIKVPDNTVAPKLIYTSKRMYYVKSNGSCLKEDKITFNHGETVNIYIVYALKSTLNYDEDITLENYLFGAVKLTKSADISKYKYSGYGIGFDGKGDFSHPSGGFGINAIIFGVDMSSSVHADNKKKDILILGEGPTQGLDCTTLTGEKLCLINFTATKTRFCLSLHYNGSNRYLFVSVTEIIKFKTKDSEVIANPLCLGNISEEYTKKTGLIGFAYDFSVDCDDIAINDKLDIPKYLMRKNGIIQNV